MSRNTTAKKYGKPSKRSKAERLFAELPQSPVRPHTKSTAEKAQMESLTEKLSFIKIEEAPSPRRSPRKAKKETPIVQDEPQESVPEKEDPSTDTENRDTSRANALEQDEELQRHIAAVEGSAAVKEAEEEYELKILAWHELCPPGDLIEKIAEASYAEVYRVTNERGTSIIKVIRLASPIKAQTKAQVRSGLVDEEPHAEDDVQGELQISEWLADIPGFVVYKDRYIVQGKATPGLLETHQKFQKKMKRQDPDRAQFYPSPSRYLDSTRFLVVELGDAGKALEDWKLDSEAQLWDVFLLEAIALARAEDLAMFEV